MKLEMKTKISIVTSELGYPIAIWVPGRFALGSSLVLHDVLVLVVGSWIGCRDATCEAVRWLAS